MLVLKFEQVHFLHVDMYKILRGRKQRRPGQTPFLYLLSRPRWFSWMHVRLVIRRLRVRPPPGRQHYFVEIDHEIFSTVILSLPLIQEGQLSVSGERMRTMLVNRLED